MEKKNFFIIIAVIALTFLLGATLKFYRPGVDKQASLASIPLEKDDWVGNEFQFDESTLQLLNPDQVFSAVYTNELGKNVHLFVDYYSPTNKSGSIHSPRNCMPGSGWIMDKTEARNIEFGGKLISAHRIYLRRGNVEQVMDFWYVTRFGETANDYKFAIYSMLCSLTFQPKDRAFIRFVTFNDPISLEAMENFESIYLSEIYSHLPF